MADQQDDATDLKAAYAPKPSGAHVSEEDWERLLAGSLGQPSRTQLFDHLVTCRSCADVFRGLKTFQQEAAAFDPHAARPVQRAATPVWMPALAATLLIAAAGWLVGRSAGPAGRVVPSQPITR